MEWIGARTEDGVGGVHGDLVLGGVADEPLAVGEGDIGRRGAVPLVVGDDLHAVVLPHAHARVGRAEVDPDGRTLSLRHCFRSKTWKSPRQRLDLTKPLAGNSIACFAFATLCWGTGEAGAPGFYWVDGVSRTFRRGGGRPLDSDRGEVREESGWCGSGNWGRDKWLVRTACERHSGLRPRDGFASPSSFYNSQPCSSRCPLCVLTQSQRCMQPTSCPVPAFKKKTKLPGPAPLKLPTSMRRRFFSFRAHFQMRWVLYKPT
jgi:hypothetical protein